MTAKRVLISIDERLLSRIDQAVATRGLTRSGSLAQLASADLESESGRAEESERRLIAGDPDLKRRTATLPSG